MNKPLTHADVARLPKGTTVTNFHTGYEHDKAGNADLGKPTFYPNRQRRREAMFMTDAKRMKGKVGYPQLIWPNYSKEAIAAGAQFKPKVIYHILTK